MNQEIRLDQPHEVFVYEPVAGIPTEPIAVVVQAPNATVENATIGAVSSDHDPRRQKTESVRGAENGERLIAR